MQSEKDMHVKVAIVGAGAAGLQCANTLISNYNLQLEDIVILEARERVGGRIYTTKKSIDDNAEFSYDNGAAWVHGIGCEWKGSLDSINNDDYTGLDPSQPNPIMPLLDQYAATTTTTTTTTATLDNNNQQQQTVFDILDPVFDGNPWMRPSKIVHDKDLMTIYCQGQELDGSSSIVQDSLDIHFDYMKQVSLMGQKLYEQGRGIETATISLQDAISRVKYEKDGSDNENIVATDQKEMVRLLVPFYQHLIECWYGKDAKNLQISEFVDSLNSENDNDGRDDNTSNVRSRVMRQNTRRRADYEFSEEGDYTGPHCTVKTGMSSILKPLLDNGIASRIHLNQEVSSITDCLTADDSIVTLQTKQGLQISANACVLTIPIGCLHAALDNNVFGPNLTPEKIEAIGHIRMGCYKKVFLTFDSIFWPDKPAFVGMAIDRSIEQNVQKELGSYMLFDNLWASKGIPCIEAVLFGTAGEWCVEKPTNEIGSAVVNFMQAAMGVTDIAYTDCHVTRWEEDPYSRGAYSSIILGTLPRHIDELNTPEYDGKLIISGEATISEYEGSVYAALLSGKNAAASVNRVLHEK